MALKDGNHCDIVWEELNPVSVSGIAGKRLQGQRNALILNVSRGLAGVGVRPLAAGQSYSCTCIQLGPSSVTAGHLLIFNCLQDKAGAV